MIGLTTDSDEDDERGFSISPGSSCNCSSWRGAIASYGSSKQRPGELDLNCWCFVGQIAEQQRDRSEGGEEARERFFLSFGRWRFRGNEPMPPEAKKPGLDQDRRSHLRLVRIVCCGGVG